MNPVQEGSVMGSCQWICYSNGPLGPCFESEFLEYLFPFNLFQMQFNDSRPYTIFTMVLMNYKSLW